MSRRHHGLAQIALAVASVALYELLRYLLHPNWPLAVRHAHEVLGWETAAHLAWEAPLQRVVLGSPLLVRALDVFYFLGHFAITAVFLVWLYHRAPAAFVRYRNALLATTVFALLIAWRFPTAPPRVAGVGVVDTLRHFSGLDIGSPGSGGLSDPVAAMPSLHAAWALAVGVGVVLHARHPLARALGAVYPLAVVLTTIVTGNHFLLDAFAGAAVLGAGFGLSRVAPSRSKLQSMQVRPALAAVGVGLVACACLAPTLGAVSGKQGMRATLHAVAPSTHGSGTFRAVVTSSKDLVTVSWTLSAAHVSGPVTSATLQSGGAHGVALPLCGPCKAPIHGRLAVVELLWKQIHSGSALVVVSTRAHPAGELRGKVTVG